MTCETCENQVGDTTWIPFLKRHPDKDGFYLVSVTYTFWDGSATYRAVSLKPFSVTNHHFYGFKDNPEWSHRVDAWQEAPGVYNG